jgi:glycosyltransferase involved in cell wall biosynthesis
MQDHISFELVIPCFNEAQTIPQLVEKTVSAAKEKGLTPQQFQLVLVDNGSGDETQERLKELKQTEWGSWFRALHLETNLGYGGGIWAGLQSTTASLLGFTHADLQCDPKDAIEALFQCVSDGEKSLVRGKRAGRQSTDWIVSRTYELAVGLTWGFWCYELNAQPKVFHRHLLANLDRFPSGIPFDAFILFSAKKNGYQLKELKVFLAKRTFGTSHWAQGITKRFRTFFRVFKELKEFSPIAQ